MSDVKCIAVASQKGGVGKTTLVLALARTLSRTRRVLVIDLDPTTSVREGRAPGTAAFLLGESVKPRQVLPNLHTLSGGNTLNSFAIIPLGIDVLARRLKGLPYDVILCDCPASNSYLESLGLHAAHDVLVALNADPWALVGAGQVLQKVQVYKELQQLRLAFVMGRWDERESLDRQMPEILEALWPELPVFKVRDDVKLATLIYTLESTSEREYKDMSAIVNYLYETKKPHAARRTRIS